MTWGILGALDAEVALIRERMDVRETVSMLGTTFYIGTVEKKEIVLVCCGIGKVNAAVCTAAIIERFGADLVVNVGIAGAMGKGLSVLDVVIADEVCFHDQDEIMLKYYPRRQFFKTDASLFALAQSACGKLETLTGTVTTGRIATGDVFVSDRETKESISARFSPACVEMEGAAIGHTAFMYGKPFLVIRTMSDAADDAAANTYDDFMDRAALQSAHIILKMLEIG